MNRLFINIGGNIGVDEIRIVTRLPGKRWQKSECSPMLGLEFLMSTISDYGKMESIPSYDASTEGY